MESVIDIRMALEQLGTGWQFGGSVTDGTQQAWDAVDWEDSRPKPTWEALLSIYADVTMQNQLAEIDKKYNAIFNGLSSAFSVAYIVDGTDMDNNISILRIKWDKAAANRELEINAVFGE